MSEVPTTARPSVTVDSQTLSPRNGGERDGTRQEHLGFRSPPSLEVSSPSEEEALSGSESPLLKITCLSIIPTAALWDSMFQGPSFSLGTRATGQEGPCPGQGSIPRGWPPTGLTQFGLPSHISLPTTPLQDPGVLGLVARAPGGACGVL